MKKGLLILCFMAGQVFGWSWKEAIEDAFDKDNNAFKMNAATDTTSSQKTALIPVCSTYTAHVLDIYVVGGDTTTTSTFQVFADSGAWVQVGGLKPGTTYAYFNYANQDTLGEFVAYWNAVSTNTPGFEGGGVLVLRQGAYDGNPTSSLTVVGATNVHSSTHTVVFNTDAIIGMTYTISATSGQVTYLTNCVVNATFAAGNTYVNIYDGTANTDTRLRREKITTSAADAKLDLGDTIDSYLFNTSGNAIRIDVVNESGTAITAGQINLLGFTK